MYIHCMCIWCVCVWWWWWWWYRVWCAHCRVEQSEYGTGLWDGRREGGREGGWVKEHTSPYPLVCVCVCVGGGGGGAHLRVLSSPPSLSNPVQLRLPLVLLSCVRRAMVPGGEGRGREEEGEREGGGGEGGVSYIQGCHTHVTAWTCCMLDELVGTGSEHTGIQINVGRHIVVAAVHSETLLHPPTLPPSLPSSLSPFLSPFLSPSLPLSFPLSLPLPPSLLPLTPSLPPSLTSPVPVAGWPPPPPLPLHCTPPAGE